MCNDTCLKVDKVVARLLADLCQLYRTTRRYSMFKRNQVLTTVAAGTLLIGATATMAQEDVDVQASVSVQNAFNLSQTQALSFGVLRVTQSLSGSLTTAPSVTINADGSAPTVTSSDGPTGASGNISVITPGVPAVFAIDSAAPNTAMTISAITSTTLTAAGTDNVFTLEFTLTDDVQVVGGPNDGSAYTGFNLVTSDTGAVGFNLGGTLATQVDDEDYIDTTYTGDYTVEVSY